MLHLIIARAQNSPHVHQVPFRALFDAYNAVLKERGLDPDHDPLYFRFLLRLGSIGGAGTLYEKFEALLEKMGIRIEFGDERSEEASVTGETKAQSHDQWDRPRRSRRASFSSFQDTMHELSFHPRDNKTRRASFSSFYDAGDEATDVHDRAGKVPSKPQTNSKKAQSSTYEAVNGTGRSPSERASRSDNRLYEPDPRARVGRVVSTQYNKDERPGRDPTSSQPETQPHNRLASITGRRNRTGVQELRQRKGVLSSTPHGDSEAVVIPLKTQQPPSSLLRLSETQMSMDSDVFFHHHMIRVTRLCLHRWHEEAMRVLPIHYRLDLTATNHDRHTLLQQALDIWRNVLRRKRQLAETQRFFAQLERRATKARNLYLLTKAFTHWAQTASDEVERTSVARRHILRTKYFGAWRELTVVNSLKVRRFALHKFCIIWKKKLEKGLADQFNAAAFYQKKLSRKCYWLWFWNFCERRAPEWVEGIMRKKYFHRWMHVVQEWREQEVWADEMRRQHILRLSLRCLSQQFHLAAEREREAASYHRRITLRDVLAEWRAQARLNPIAMRVSDLHDWRLAHRTLAIWTARTRAQRQAAEVDRRRILRNAWTAWNDRLRLQSLAIRIDERVLLQSLYKWVLAERYVLYRRLADRRLEQRMFTTIVQKWNSLQARLWHCQQKVEATQNRHILKAAVNRWLEALTLQRQKTQLAAEFDGPRLASDAMQLWARQLTRIRELESNAGSASFYFLATRHLKIWREAMLQSRRQKRQLAYAQVRRNHKMSMARNMLRLWKNKAAETVRMHQMATEIYNAHLIAIATKEFYHWHDRSDHIVSLTGEATALRSLKLCQQGLLTWRNELNRRRELEVQAIEQSELFVLKHTAGLLRRLRVLAFQHRNHEKMAEEFCWRNDRQHCRNILRFWKQKAAQINSGTLYDPTLQAYYPGDDEDDNGTPSHTRVSPLDMGSGPERPVGGTPRPLTASGYFNTPSKRAARAKALVRLAATPRTPVPAARSTNLNRSLRSQLFTDRMRNPRENDLPRRPSFTDDTPSK